MKIHVLSDLHTEFSDFDAPETDADAVILAGDIGVGASGLEWAARQFRGKPVIYVPGNHEYYDHDIGFVGGLQSGAPSHIHVLDRDAREIDGVRFLGTTLWTDFAFYGEDRATTARRAAQDYLADYRVIKNGDRPFSPEDSAGIHESSKAWLIGELEKAFDGPTVVVTHHLPAVPSIAERYRDNPLNPAFASRLEPLIEQHRPELWIHGHTHAACDYEIFATRVVCNPRGYPGEMRQTGFDPGLCVRVGEVV